MLSIREQVVLEPKLAGGKKKVALLMADVKETRDVKDTRVVKDTQAVKGLVNEEAKRLHNAMVMISTKILAEEEAKLAGVKKVARPILVADIKGT